MANTEAQAIWDEAECFACIQENSNFIVMLLALLNRGLVAAGGEAMTAQELMTEGSCFACIPTMTQGQAMTLAAMNGLVAAIEAGGGGGGGALHAPGAVDPNGVVTATAAGEYYSNTTGGTTWVSTAAGNSSWVQTV